jgi:hypothetical protein
MKQRSGPRRWWMSLRRIFRSSRVSVWLPVAAMACASGGVTPVARTPDPDSPRLAVLFDVWSEREANVVAVSHGGAWQSAIEFGREALKRVVAHHPDYTLLPSVTAGTTTAARGKLTGDLHEHCYEINAALAAPSLVYGFGALSTVAPIRPEKLEPATVAPTYFAVVAKLLRDVAHVEVTPVIERAYQIDLDGDGRREVVLQATHPDLNDAPPDYKPEYYSLIAILPGSGSARPAFSGYMQGSDERKHFEVLTLDAVTDLDFDGTLDLLVRARHAEGWQTRILRYAGGQLTETFRSVGGEGECPEEGQ